jgi:phage host-nuclease inhibitor protein Gam
MYSLINGVEVLIGKKLMFKEVLNVKIEQSTRLLSSTCTIELPLSAVFENSKKLTLANEIKKGDSVVVRLGYDNDLRTEFVGYVQEITDKGKTEIKCEDTMYLLRKPLANKIFKNTTLAEVVRYIAGNVPLNATLPQIEFNSFVVKNITGVQALQKIKDNYGLTIFIDNEQKVYCGLAYLYMTGKVIYDLQSNVVDNDLTYKHADELKFKIKAISLQKDNTKLEVETGDNDGDLRTLYFQNIANEKKLKELANEEINKYKYTGYRGTLTCFGLPYATMGMSAVIRDKNYPVRAGVYYVEGVTTSFGRNGFRRTVELGIKL